MVATGLDLSAVADLVGKSSTAKNAVATTGVGFVEGWPIDL